MPSVRVPPEIIGLTEDSYRRCQQDGFFEAFYARLLASDPQIAKMFANTDWTRQRKVLQHSLGLLLAYGRPGNGKILDRIAARHGRGDLNIAPRYYPFFADAIVATVRDFDPQFNKDVEEAWRRSLEPGLNYLASFYQAQA